MVESVKKDIKAYLIEGPDTRAITSRFTSTGKVTKYMFWALVDDDEDIQVVSTFKEDVTKRLSLERPYKIMRVTQTKYGNEIKNDTTIMQTGHFLSEAQEASIRKFREPQKYTLAEAGSIANNKRITIGPVEVVEVGQQMKTSFSERRQLNIGAGGRMALLTLWGKLSEVNILPGIYCIKCVKPTNDFNGQRCFNSTPGTTFEAVEEDDEAEVSFQGIISSVSFESNLVEIGNDILSISDTSLNLLFPEQEFREGVEVNGERRQSLITRISPICRGEAEKCSDVKASGKTGKSSAPADKKKKR